MRLSKISARFDSKDPAEVEAFVKDATSAAMAAFGPDAVLDLRQQMWEHGKVIFQDVPLEKQLPPNPVTGSNRFPKSSQISEASIIGIGQLFGQLLGYKVETSYSHPLVHDGFPLSGANSAAVSSPRPQQYHQDMSYLDDAEVPDFLALLCLREGHVATKTGLIDNREIVRRLSPKTQAILRDPRNFLVKQPAWVGNEAWHDRVVHNQTANVVHKAMLSGPASWPSIATRVNGDDIIPDGGRDSIPAQALAELWAAIDETDQESSRGVFLRRGDLLVFNNKKMLHRRFDTTVSFDGFDRVIQRAYFHTDPGSLIMSGRIHQESRWTLAR
jgi:alpha-ketoglutarate-dependent taurine dioxygenase